MLKDKDVIVLMGPTGCGKTTITQMLLGYRLKKSRN
jgi:ABC-type sugar transport system ATPase subunit